MKSLQVMLAATTLALAAAAGVQAHGDEDHSQDAKKTPAAPGSATPGAPAALQRLADGSLFVPKPVQRQLGIRTLPVRIGDLAATVELNGKGIVLESKQKGTAMQLEGAVIKEQGQTFAVVVVKRHVTDDRHEASSAMQSFSRCFPGMPIVLMSQDSRGVA